MKEFTKMLGWCMWQTMHWLVGIALVKTCFSGWPDSPCGMVGSTEALAPSWPNLA